MEGQYLCKVVFSQHSLSTDVITKVSDSKTSVWVGLWCPLLKLCALV